jgi:hypothetical protein
MKRSSLLIGALLLTAQASVASFPSARTETRMVYDARTTHMILFGGASAVDSGTKLAYDISETWEWTGARWVERYPASSPSARSNHAMVYDRARDRVVLFAGKSGTITVGTTPTFAGIPLPNELNDTWIYQNDTWTQLATPSSPSKRQLPGMTYDSIRDRIVLFGGTQTTSTDGRTSTANSLTDTWEFDGTTWTQRASTGPQVAKPILQYDAARNQVIMMGLDSNSATLMYTYDPAAGAWNQIKPATFPACVNESAMTYQPTKSTVLLTGGVCNTSSLTDETWEWDGTTWTKINTTSTDPDRVFGQALAFDESRGLAMVYGGTQAFASPRSATWVYGSTLWLLLTDTSTPSPRSQFVLKGDPNNNTLWLFGGFDDGTNYIADFWKYQNGQWQQVTSTGGPASCITPTGAYDTDRKKLVIVCSSSDTYEWDGTNWTKDTITDSGKKPPVRRFSSMVYDQTLKKTVLLGGLDSSNAYLDQTWMWDGATWTQQKNHPTTAREHASMWYDPIAKKTIVYGGIGRPSTLDRITRYNDMWSFDGSGWTDMKITATPGMRYGAQTTVDPRTSHLLLLGGLRVDTDATTQIQTQVYANDMWEWDGTAWKQLVLPNLPPTRENGGLEYDPSRRQMTLFAGYGGFFHDDVWIYDQGIWTVRDEAVRHRRPVTSLPAGSSGNNVTQSQQ